MEFEKHKEDMVRQLVRMKERIDETVRMIDKADSDKELLLALINSPMGQQVFHGRK